MSRADSRAFRAVVQRSLRGQGQQIEDYLAEPGGVCPADGAVLIADGTGWYCQDCGGYIEDDEEMGSR